jgi:hypothetical protein
MRKYCAVPVLTCIMASCMSTPAPRSRAAEPGVYLTLRCGSGVVGKSDQARFWAVFTNTTAGPVSVLKPHRGSYEGGVSPVYRFHVMNTATNEEVGLVRESGTRPAPKYSDTCRALVPSDSSVAVRLGFPFDLRKGAYSVSMEYWVSTNRVVEGRGALPDSEYLLPDLFVGRLVSDTVQLKVSR